MKFKNPSLIFVRTDGQTDGRMDKPKAICTFNLFQSWEHKNVFMFHGTVFILALALKTIFREIVNSYW